MHRRLQRRIVLHGGVRPAGHQRIERAVGERKADVARGVVLRRLCFRHARRQPQIGFRRHRVEQRLAMDEMVVERAVRDADFFGHLAQAQALMAVLRHQTGGGLERVGSDISVAIGRAARFCGHASSYKAVTPDATASCRGPVSWARALDAMPAAGKHLGRAASTIGIQRLTNGDHGRQDCHHRVAVRPELRQAEYGRRRAGCHRHDPVKDQVPN